MSRIFVILTGLVIFGAAQATPPRGATQVFGGNQGQYNGPYQNGQNGEQYGGQQYGQPADYGYDNGDTNYVETPAYDDSYDNSDSNYEDQGNYDDNYQNASPSPHGGPSSDDMERIYQSVLAATKGACNIKENPHSFGCNEWTFTNNPVFPLFQIDWRGLQGDWFMVTYANKASENRGREFYMEKNPERPTQPMGVKNTADDSLVGRMWIQGTQVTFENWRGHRVSSDPASFKVKDAYTVQFDLWTGPQGKQTLHSFDCRDFNRNNDHHLLCDWWVQSGNKWIFKGYFGFITLDAWEGFLSQAGSH